MGAKTLFDALSQLEPSFQTPFWCPNTVSDAFCPAFIDETGDGTRYGGMNVYVNTVRSVDDELKRAVFVDIPLMAGTYGAMATF